MTDRATDNVLAVTTRTPGAQHLQGFFQQFGSEGQCGNSSQSRWRHSQALCSCAWLSGTSRGNDYDHKCCTRANVACSRATDLTISACPLNMQGTTDMSQVAYSAGNSEAQDTRFFFHEYGRRVGMVPRSSLKEGKNSQMVEKKDQDNPTNKKQPQTTAHRPSLHHLVVFPLC